MKNICEWVMNLVATKHMILHRVAFNTYEVIFPHMVHLDNVNMAKTIGMGSIVDGVEMIGKTTRICITNMLHMPKLQTNLLLVSKFLSNGLYVQFQINNVL